LLDEPVTWIDDWPSVLKFLTSRHWDDYLLDIRNAIGNAVPRPYIDDWNWSVHEVNHTIFPDLPEAMKLRIPIKGTTAEKGWP
jgi:hypothetical protein